MRPSPPAPAARPEAEDIMMKNASQYPEAMRIVDHYYQSGVRGQLTDFAP